MAWLEWRESKELRRRELASGVTRLGGRAADVDVTDSGSDELQVWDDPPKLIFVGSGARPEVAGRAVEEAFLMDGDTIRWRGREWAFGGVQPPASAEHAPSLDALTIQTGRRLLAGIAVESGAVEREVLRRWQEAADRGPFDPDVCAEDLLAATSLGKARERVLDRAGAKLREALKLARRASPVARAARPRFSLGGFVVQLVVLALMAAIAIGTLVVLRTRWGVSIDRILDAIRDRLFGGS